MPNGPTLVLVGWGLVAASGIGLMLTGAFMLLMGVLPRQVREPPRERERR